MKRAASEGDRSTVASLRRYFLTGLVAVAPLAITLWILWQFYKLINGAVRPVLGRIPGLVEVIPEFFLTLIGLLVFVCLIMLIGRFTGNLVGAAFFGLVERLANRIPLVKSVFATTKQISAVFLGAQRSAFQKVALFQYPREGLYSLGFVTSDYPEHRLMTIFLPTTPNPTSGYLLLVPRDQLTLLDITVEEGIRLIISGGAVMARAEAEMLAERVARLAVASTGIAPEGPPLAPASPKSEERPTSRVTP